MPATQSTMSFSTKSSHHEPIFEICSRKAKVSESQMFGERQHNTGQDGGLICDACYTVQLIMGLESM